MMVVQLKITTGNFQGVPPLSSFYIQLVSLTDANNKLLQGVPQCRSFSPPGSLQNQSHISIVTKKNKALPDGGQQLNSKKRHGTRPGSNTYKD